MMATVGRWCRALTPSMLIASVVWFVGGPRAIFGLWLVAVLVWIALMVSRRVIVAWWVYFALRHDPRFSNTPEARAWLWQETLARANGKDGR